VTVKALVVAVKTLVMAVKAWDSKSTGQQRRYRTIGYSYPIAREKGI
jgi:hypothetical protein